MVSAPSSPCKALVELCYLYSRHSRTSYFVCQDGYSSPGQTVKSHVLSSSGLASTGWVAIQSKVKPKKRATDNDTTAPFPHSRIPQDRRTLTHTHTHTYFSHAYTHILHLHLHLHLSIAQEKRHSKKALEFQ